MLNQMAVILNGRFAPSGHLKGARGSDSSKTVQMQSPESPSEATPLRFGQRAFYAPGAASCQPVESALDASCMRHDERISGSAPPVPRPASHTY
jgi:hypothetical protein